jgi:hypothetical protein
MEAATDRRHVRNGALVSRFTVRSAAQICADPGDEGLLERPDDLANAAQLEEIAEIKNCDYEDVRAWERGIMEEARQYAESLINTAVAKAIVDVPSLETARRLRVIEAADFAGGYDDEGVNWLIDQVLPARGVGMIWGASGAHKTGVALDLLATVHSGAASWRDKAVTRGRGVLVVAEGQHFFRNRLRAYSKQHSIAMASMPAVVLSPVNLRDSKQVAIFAQELLKLGAAQCWFDTLQQNSAGSDGNSDKDMGEVVANLKWLSDKIGGFCGVLHHEGKSGHDRGPRGSSVWRPALDLELYVESPDGVHGLVHVEKLKDGPPSGVYPFRREVVGLDRYENGRPVTSIAIVQDDTAPIMRIPKLPKVGTKKRAAFDAIKAVITEHGGSADLQDARDAIIKGMVEPAHGERDRRASRAGTAIEDLLASRLLFLVDGKLSDTQIVKGESSDPF